MKPWYVSILVTLLAPILLSGADDKKKESQTQTQTQTQTSVTMTNEVIQQGTSSGIKDAIAKIITTQKEWEELWKRHVSVLVPQPPVPPVDFESEVVAVIFAGEKRTSGYRVILKNVAAEGNDGVITYKLTEPPDNSFILQVLSQPFVILKVEKPQGTVKLLRE